MAESATVEAAVRAALNALRAQYGEDAAIIATMRAAEEAATGDLEASDFWARVVEALESGGGPGEALN